MEAAQNAIDADADRILIGIDLRNRNVFVLDNGLGVSRNRFEEALASVGKGVKTRDRLGRFGRGLIAPLDKCRRFTFTSSPSGMHPKQWTFVGDEIRKQHHELQVPLQELREFPKLPRWLALYAVDTCDTIWRTQVALHGITKDRVVSLVDLDDLESQIRQKLGQTMRKNNVVIRVVMVSPDCREESRDINPIAYSGQRLDVVSYTDSIAGGVYFELYRATKLGGSRRGDVVVMEMDGSTPITMREFGHQARAGEWREILEPAMKALMSGYFEGVIRCENITLSPERTKFEYNEPLHALYLVISQWYEEHGKRYFDDEEEINREQRYQDLGLRSQQRLRDVLINRPEFQRIWEGLKSAVKFGRLGDGHVDPEHGRPNGLDGDNTIRSGQGGAGGRKGEGNGETREPRSRESKDRPGDIPTGASGPRGGRRTLVKGDSVGLWFEYSWLEGSYHLWDFDFDHGVLSFNVRHPIWVMLDETNGRHTQKNDRYIMALQEWLALEVLVLLMRCKTKEDLEEVRDFLDTKIRPYVELFILTPASR